MPKDAVCGPRLFGGTQCLDATGSATTVGTKVGLWNCNGGADQQWRLN
ncbi:ricin-type beta-trefoil lectin domain protein [Streptomyces sp. NBC_01451]|nr:ricin-type beta-trefoil lectin domain protein [Streptomyces sp. NBC_01451]